MRPYNIGDDGTLCLPAVRLPSPPVGGDGAARQDMDVPILFDLPGLPYVEAKNEWLDHSGSCDQCRSPDIGTELCTLGDALIRVAGLAMDDQREALAPRN